MIGRSLRRLVAWPLSVALALGLAAPAVPVAQGAGQGLALQICTSGGVPRTLPAGGESAPAGHDTDACALCAGCAGACAPGPAGRTASLPASRTSRAASCHDGAAPARAHWLAAHPRAPPSGA